MASTAVAASPQTQAPPAVPRPIRAAIDLFLQDNMRSGPVWSLEINDDKLLSTLHCEAYDTVICNNAKPALYGETYVLRPGTSRLLLDYMSRFTFLLHARIVKKYSFQDIHGLALTSTVHLFDPMYEAKGCLTVIGVRSRTFDIHSVMRSASTEENKRIRLYQPTKSDYMTIFETPMTKAEFDRSFCCVTLGIFAAAHPPVVHSNWNVFLEACVS